MIGFRSRVEQYQAAILIGRWTLEIVKRSDTAKGFEVLPRRWVVVRTSAWLGRRRRLAKDWDKSIASSEAWIHIVHIRPTTRDPRKGLQNLIEFRIRLQNHAILATQDPGRSQISGPDDHSRCPATI